MELSLLEPVMVQTSSHSVGNCRSTEAMAPLFTIHDVLWPDRPSVYNPAAVFANWFDSRVSDIRVNICIERSSFNHLNLNNHLNI